MVESPTVNHEEIVMYRPLLLSWILLGVSHIPAFGGCGGGPEWGAAKDGVATSLTLVTAKPTLGQPLRVKLEIRNTGTADAVYDDQQAATNASLTVKGPDGALIPYIGGSYQTAGQPTTLKPGQAKTIFQDLDVAAQYLIEQPGEFTIQSRNRGNVPASNVLKVTVQNGQLSDFDRLFAALHRATPKGWRVANYSGSIVFLNAPTHLKADATSISLFFTKEPTGGPKPQPGQPAPVNLGPTTLGQAWLMADSQRAVDRWPDYAKVIGERVKPFKK
jgi:hypothetical protein